MSVFPTTSSSSIELDHYHWDGEKLKDLAAAALERRAHAPPDEIPSTPSSSNAPAQAPSSPDHVHLHTWTLEVSMITPDSHIYYPLQDELRPNPDFTMLQNLHETISASSPAMDPFELLPMSKDWLRSPPKLDMRRTRARFRMSIAGMYHPRQAVSTQRPVMDLGMPRLGGAKDWLSNSSAADTQGWLQALLALDHDEPATRKGHYRNMDRKVFWTESSLSIVWMPETEEGPLINHDGREMERLGYELKMIVTVRVYVDLEKLAIPQPEVGQDLQGLVLFSLLPGPVTAPYKSESHARQTALRNLYECMRPAPLLPRYLPISTLQPEEMVSKLHPFQMRTLALLLDRERSNLIREPPKPTSVDPAGWWTEVDFGVAGRYAYRRLTGELIKLGAAGPASVDKGKKRESDLEDRVYLDGLTPDELRSLPSLMDISGVRGTMLCEEMGLGKTVEAIALTLLHRHPLSSARPVTPPSESLADTHASGSRIRRPEVPIIDLYGGPPDLDDPNMLDWMKAQASAFNGTKKFDETSQVHVTDVAATLIVTPPSLLKQWVTEIRAHSPGLRVCVYDGWQSLIKGVRRQKDANIRELTKRKKAADKLRKEAVARKYRKAGPGGRLKIDLAESDSEEEDSKEGILLDDNSLLEVTQRQFLEYVRAHDIVITTYQDLSSDLTVANPVAARSRRSTANYQLNERPRSPLVMVEWWRIIMDEVQLCADSSQAANMVTHLPRKNSLAVSGTPAKSDINDLLGSLRFLGVPVLPYNTKLWHRLQQPPLRPAFQGLFQQITVRTTKQEVTDELHIPPQMRYIVPIGLSDIELHYYQDTLERQQTRLQRAAGELDRALLRSCLLDLRQICTHLQVGHMQDANRGAGRGQRLHLGKQVMTMKEALDVMKIEHAQELQIEIRNELRTKIRQAQLIMMVETDDRRFVKAIALYESVRRTTNDQLVKAREHLASLLDGRGDSDKESELESGPAPLLSQQEKERAAMLTSARTTIRELLHILHQGWFFEGDTRHQQKKVDLEITCYNNAEEVRKEVLQEPLKKASGSITALKGLLDRATPLEGIEDLQTTTVLYGGLLSAEVCAQANALLGLLNDNAQLVWQWRNKIIELLSSPIEGVDDQREKGVDVDNPEEEFYAEALEAQGKVEAYMIAYAAAIADRKEMMIEDKSFLIEHEARLVKARGTRTAKDAAIDFNVVDKPAEVSTEAQVLLNERQRIRDKRSKKDCERPLKAMLVDFSRIELSGHRDEEKALCRTAANAIKQYNKTQMGIYDKLNAELDKFRAVFNQRVKYFAALQAISDSVTAPTDFTDLRIEIEDCGYAINESEAKIGRMIVKGRYLQYLATRDDNIEELRESCIICMGSSEDEKGVLLGCGHYFCASCMQAYRSSAQGRTCPNCRAHIDYKTVTKIMMPSDGEAMAVPSSPEVTVGGPSAEGQRSPEDIEAERAAEDLEKLRYMSLEMQREISQLDIMGEWGSKINFLVKHLVHSQAHSPTTRHVIFSNWSDSLWIVTRALSMNGIKFIAFDSGRKSKDVVERFHNDESITVFLLHAERESSGLTLTSCSVVHLLEPVLQHSFELQAIGRVDRLGQKKETQVYCYATRNTVESRILVRGVRNATSIYLKDDTADMVVANMPNVASAAHRFGDLSNEGNEEELLGLIM